MKANTSLTGYSLAFLAALLWGMSGTLAQFLFQKRGVNPEWLVTLRLLISGVILLSYPLLKNSRRVFEVWKSPKDAFRLLGFGIFGMLAVQYTYFAAINHSNAATATILQYSGPVFIVCYYSFLNMRVPVLRELAAIVFALIGTFLIVTHGSLESLSISGTAMFWGISSAIALAIYSVSPASLMNRFDAGVVVGWGMLIGGLALSCLYPPFEVSGYWDTYSYLFSAGVIVLGTTVAFYSYLMSVKLIGATKASLLACAEPLSAAVIAVVWLKVEFGIYDWIGSLFILITIGLLTVKSKEKKPNSHVE